MKRRTFLLSSLAAAISGRALAQIDMASNPFMKVGPFQSESRTVFAFFSFSCTYCQQHQMSISSWGSSIPKKVSFEDVPVVVDKETFNAARAFYAAKKTDPARLNRFLQTGLSAARSGYTDLTAKTVVEGAGFDFGAYNKALYHPDVKKAIQRATELTLRYQIAATPSLAIGGQMVIHADHVGGDYGLLMRLASGFVSRILEAA